MEYYVQNFSLKILGSNPGFATKQLRDHKEINWKVYHNSLIDEIKELE